MLLQSIVELALGFHCAVIILLLRLIALTEALILQRQAEPLYMHPAKGLVKYVATLSGYGNVIYLKHGSEYVTVYAHLSKFAKGLKSGKRVKKQVSSLDMWALLECQLGHIFHYEIRINGVHKDAEKVKLNKKSIVPNAEMASFQKRAKQILTKLKIK